MSIEAARSHLARFGQGGNIIEFAVSSATVELAALALGTEPGRIAKTLAFGRGGLYHLIVVAGDARVDNVRYKARFGMKATMLSVEETLEVTGHQVGGVCPFGLPRNIDVWLDESLRRYDYVYPACGSSNSALRCGIQELELWSGSAGWVDISRFQGPQSDK